ncbi:MULTISPECIES: DUF3099 domain-containing protein [Streptomycetaceae]|uniref:DUF3099 domain-containing protein n=1 Tax=Streptantibioticus cattleyicolor (strain ATCC 35852 / DSM 46488 / JCM 4925 / NBRC 14057 / NRRL 8057) TaxID=1003195 RepID=G8WNR1_STREN|nr:MULTISPECIES: DUF3099 domain-containing protein [Streptomycetaceae]AEW93384.1 hypothetical protein SCATT_10130 [Streptantibioticus cattleyicolor NRRL 8057 = DSM 46488]MYS58098.1 DUF3099 domain-containing protein [Streptomyces sp. SID5468]
MRKHGGAEVFRITGARAGLSEDVKGRQRRYVISMSIRTVCFLLAIALWHVQVVLAAVALVAGGVLPYIAVVIANAGRENNPVAPTSFVPAPTRGELGAGAVERGGQAAEPGAAPGRAPGEGYQTGDGGESRADRPH